MTDSNNTSVAVVGPKDVIRVFDVCGFKLYYSNDEPEQEIVERIKDEYPLILVTDGDYNYETPYPIVMKIPRKIGRRDIWTKTEE